MSYGRFLAGEPLFWAMLAGLFAGIAFASILRPVHRARRPTRAAARRWTWAWLALSVAVAAAALGLIVPEGLAILSPAAGWTTAASLVAGFLAVRYPRVIGIPIVVLMGTAAVLASWVVAPFEPVRTQRELARASVLSIRDDTVSFELMRSDADAPDVPQVMILPGTGITFAADVLDFSWAWYLLGSRRFVRYRAPGDTLPAPPNRVREALVRWGQASEVQLTVDAGRVNLMRTYVFLAGPSGPPIVVTE